jgi:A/G-specific adenine glycosylase
MIFSKALIQWYLQNKRDLLGNTTIHTPIWLSEIMLQQTRGRNALFFVFHNISHCFDLAEASEEQVLKLWQG